MRDRDLSHTFRTLSLLLLLPCLGLMSSGCGKDIGKLPRARAPRERLPRVEAVQPKRGPWQRKLDLAANIEPLQRVELSARVAGIARIGKDIDIGKSVKKDEILLTLDVPDLRADKRHKESMLALAEKQVKQAEKALEVARQEVREARQQEEKFVAEQEFYELRHERIVSLVKVGSQDRQLAEEAKRQLDTARAARLAAREMIATRDAKVAASGTDLEAAKTKVEVAEAEVKKLTEQIGFATIKAPFDGIITRRWVDQGATIKDAGAPLLTVMEMHKVRVLIDIPLREVSLVNRDVAAARASASGSGKPGGSVSEGDRVVVRVPELEAVGVEGTFNGRIKRFGEALDPVTRTMRAEVELENPRVKPRAGQREMYALRPGMYGRAEVYLDERANVLIIPSSAVVRRNEVMGVYVVAHAQGTPPRGELRFVELKLGLDDGKRIEVREGLTGEELVVAKGSGMLRVGDEVLALPPQEE